MPPTPEPKTYAEVKAAIEAGKPDTLTEAATAFKNIADAVDQVSEDAAAEASKLTTGADPWEGPSATAFSSYMTDFDSRLDDGATAIKPYKAALDGAATALTKAQEDLSKLEVKPTNTATEADKTKLDAQAVAILNTLAGKYRAAIKQLTPMPGAAKNGGDAGGGGGDGAKGGGDGDAKGGDGDAKGGGGEAKGGGGDPIPKGDPTTGVPTNPIVDGGTGGPGSDGPSKGGTPQTDTAPLFNNDPSKSPVTLGLGNPDAPTGGLPAFDGRPPSPLDPGSGGGSGTPGGIGRDGGGDVPTHLTRLPSGTAPLTPPGGGTPGVTPGVTPGGPVTLGPGPGSALIPPMQRSTLTTSGPSRSRATGSNKGTELAQTGPRAPMMPLYPAGVIGRQEERAAERETWLIGDEDWSDTGAADDAIGRPRSQGTDAPSPEQG